MLKTCERFFREKCGVKNMLIFKTTCYCQIISALNSWITFNNHHQYSDMEIIIQIIILNQTH